MRHHGGVAGGEWQVVTIMPDTQKGLGPIPSTAQINTKSNINTV